MLAQLMAVVRAEFRADVLRIPADDAVFGTGECKVVGCTRLVHGRGLCGAHLQRWVGEGRPDLEAFIATTDPRFRLRRPNLRCRIDGCGYGSARKGLCTLHAQRWERCARPDLDAWLASPPSVKQPAVGAACRIEHCALWPQASSPFCLSHHKTWRDNDFCDVESFIARFSDASIPVDEIRLEVLPARLRLEFGYLLQCRSDERGAKTAPTLVTQAIRIVLAAGVDSILELSEDQWHLQVPTTFRNARSLILYAVRKLTDLRDGQGWEHEYARDTWHLRRLGYPGDHRLRFAAIPQGDLRTLAKRWLRLRLSSGLAVETARRGLRAITGFAQFCARINITELSGIDRDALECFLAELHAQRCDPQQEGDRISQVNAFLAAIRSHQWDQRLAAGAMFFPEDYPRRRDKGPRALPEPVMAQIEAPDNLARFADPAHRLVTIVLIRCGLRVTDALRLHPDCVLTDAAGAPFLRYVNHKMKREALVPIDEELRDLIEAHRSRHASAHWLLPRATKNPDGAEPIASSTYRAALYRWLQGCQIRDEHGQPVHLTPHQWRHTLGTRLINRDVPQEVVRRILDHDSPLMTAHYARLHDDTVRRHWEAARKVDARGEHVSLDPDGPLAEAAWANQRLSRATQALPNGYCSLPVIKTCPHANACLTCPMFLTTAEFLPQHKTQRHQVMQIISAAEARGQTRLAEMNRQVADNLTSIITALEDTREETRTADAS